MVTKWFILCRDRLLITAANGIPCAAAAPVSPSPSDRVMRLPDDDTGHPCRAISVASAPDIEGMQWTGLRETFDRLSRADYQMAGKARELLHWDEGTRYCGRCGAPMEMHTDISKRCTRCGVEVWPSPATAIIVAVTRGDDILLVQSRSFRGDYLGLVAGFVETGETLEECVHREVMEETGLTIRRVRYVESQAWPYPFGLMVGFRAEYAGGEIRLQRSELNKGGWYHRDALPAIPGPVSLARRLIDAWLNEGTK